MATAKTNTAPSVMVPGNHDGVHLGHRALIERARTHADAHGLRTVVLTFDPHPAAILAPERAPTPLTTLARRTALLREAGVDDVAIQPFTHEYAAQTPEAFLGGLASRGARAIVVGPDFRFGKGRAGNVELMRQFGAETGLEVLVEPPVIVEYERVSSSAVRAMVADGDLERASQWLGRVHDVDGKVVAGERRGRTIGFPTANLAPAPVLVPKDGVYAIVARTEDGALHRGAANIGVRPTLGTGRAIEAHLFDFDGDLYDTTLRVGFVKRLRGEQKFDGLDALKAQIAKDCDEARAVLDATDAKSWARM